MAVQGISGIAGALTAVTARDPADAPPGTGPLERLLARTSPLDRLLADAGPLGKFRTDQPDAMPSGTSALTLRLPDIVNRAAARLGEPGERVLNGTTAYTAEIAARPDPDVRPGQTRGAPESDRLVDAKAAIRSEPENRSRSL